MQLIALIHYYADACRKFPSDIPAQQNHFREFLPTVSLGLCAALQEEFDMDELDSLHNLLSVILDKEV